MADIRVGQPNDEHIAGSERAATWMSVGVVAAISLVAKDPTIFIIGGSAAVIMAWYTRHANVLNPLTNSVSSEGMIQRLDLAPQPPDETADANLEDDSVVGF
jgi:hypothetical protein